MTRQVNDQKFQNLFLLEKKNGCVLESGYPGSPTSVSHKRNTSATHACLCARVGELSCTMLRVVILKYRHTRHTPHRD